MSKIALGTVQFGLDYGINNKKGKIHRKDVFDILEFASKHGIDILDTAHSYGNSEKIIGGFLSKSEKSFKIVSKVPQINDEKNLQDYFIESLRNLGVSELYAYLFHNFQSYIDNPTLLDDIYKLKNSGKIQKVGFSLYYPSELEYLINNNIDFDILQVPYSVFDQRFGKYFEKLRKKKVEIHIRSVFLQGLVFKDLSKLEARFDSIRGKLIILNNISTTSGLSISALCLNFAVLNRFIDRVIIGVDSLANLKENLIDLHPKFENKVSEYYSDLKQLSVDDEKVILPINWK